MEIHKDTKTMKILNAKKILSVLIFSLFALLWVSSHVYAADIQYVSRVVDGDTLVMRGGERVRLIGVDTPETVHPQKPVEYYGKEASAFTKKEIEGKRVRLEYDQDKKGKYGRTLAYVYRTSDNFFLNAEIIKQGYGYAYTKYPFKHMERFRGYERDARRYRRGLWGGDKSQIKKDYNKGSKGSVFNFWNLLTIAAILFIIYKMYQANTFSGILHAVKQGSGKAQEVNDIKNKPNEVKTWLAVSVAALFIGVLPMPYGYYTLLRIIVCGSMVYLAYKSQYIDVIKSHRIALIIIAILFNPIIPIHFDRMHWVLIDMGVGAYLFMILRRIDERVGALLEKLRGGINQGSQIDVPQKPRNKEAKMRCPKCNRRYDGTWTVCLDDKQRLEEVD